ncbi:helix-turn-helix domain-containing protein [Clostridium sp. 'White wine YQ']|uniref:helix-turn-helix domain-containing protein n=1 Tax=Clostridium sp. 'White wine YQ' TaxID=3027474 RepID=UPI0023667080|nr:helix-turn-helix domain-containing protein [Clostridium sp. 'White wine YQ']MDD7795136.1 helix-turn-helix domain-containing protein [Clostridium sp. 'White wine YQ']
MSRVGEKIKKARESSGLTQKALAKKLGLAEKYINEVELGRKVLSENLIDRIGKVLNTDLNDISMVVTDEELMKEVKKEPVRKAAPSITTPKMDLREVNEDWSNAFSSVFRKVPIYNYDFTKEFGAVELPVHSNKINGYTVDKVFYIVIEEEDMLGFRISKGDKALVHSVKEIESNSIMLLEHQGKRIVRQVKKLDNTKVLLVSNKGNLVTDTVSIKDIKPLAKLDKIEIEL